AEAGDEEVGLRLPVQLEGDMIVERRGIRCWRLPCPAGHHGRPHHVRIASRTIAAAVMAVRPDGSHRGDTSTRSKPTTCATPRWRSAASKSGTLIPPGSGAPVPGATDGSRTSMSIVT